MLDMLNLLEHHLLQNANTSTAVAPKDGCAGRKAGAQPLTVQGLGFRQAQGCTFPNQRLAE